MIQPKISIVFIGLLFFLNAFYGCSGLKKEPLDKNYFDISINLTASNQSNINHGGTLLIKEFAINLAFDSHSFVYRIEKNEYLNDYYNEFISYPAKLITQKIEEGLCSSQYFRSAQTNMKQDIDFRLSGKITRLYGDYQEPDNPKAMIEIRMVLEKRADNTFKVITGKTYTAHENISSRKPAHLVSGWNAGLSKIVIQFINDFNPPD